MADKPKRNDPCHCGSGNKYKNCCQNNDDKKKSSWLGIAGLVILFVFGLWLFSTYVSGSSQPDCPPGTVWSDAHQHCH